MVAEEKMCEIGNAIFIIQRQAETKKNLISSFWEKAKQKCSCAFIRFFSYFSPYTEVSESSIC